MNEPFAFGRFRFEPDTARLWTRKREVKLTPKAAAVLGRLIARGGEPVTKEELFAEVWRGTVVSDDALVTCIQELRKALGDDAKKPRFIETRHRRGYRFAAEITGGAPSAPVAAQSVAEGRRGPAIAVLPFTDMSPGRDQSYLCEGLAEELIDALTHVEGLRVTARSSSFQFRDPGADIKDVGRRLDVDSVVEGSVRKAGNKLRVTVQLIDTATAFHKWSERFDRELDDVFAIQDEIAETVASIVRGSALSRREKRAVRRTTTSTDVYEYYLRGRQSVHRMTRPDLEHSQAMFRAAIEIDAEYAPAWAGLAQAHAQEYEWFGSDPVDLAEAERASRIAMDLNPELADAHVARGFTMSLHRNYDLAEKHFEAAARINPQLFDAFYLLGRSCFARGQVERSATLFGRAGAVRPEDFQSIFLQGQSLRMLGRAEEARVANTESIRRAHRLLELNPRDIRTLSLGSGALFADGQKERAFEWAERALGIDPKDMGAIVNAACIHSVAGNIDRAIELLENAFGLGWGKRDWIENDHDYDPLRSDPRFQAMVAKLK
jgi:adenylate cyclase